MPNELELLTGSISNLTAAYRSGATTPSKIIDAIISASAAYSQCNIWIEPPAEGLIEPYVKALNFSEIETKPLWGVPFAIKDNIDLEGVDTTAACPAFRYTPVNSAFVVERFIDAGAIPIGKTNLDQFATGLVGTRSPYGVCTHPERPDHISGGSSSGSAVAVSLGLAAFALGTDTAGSGRIPAAFNDIYGMKPSKGLVSNRGVIPACKTLDCVSLFARSTEELALLAEIAVSHDPAESFSVRNVYPNRPKQFGHWSNQLRLGVISNDLIELSSEYKTAHQQTIEKLSGESRISFIEIDFNPFKTAARELYEGPWITERYLVLKELLDTSPSEIFDVTREVIQSGAGYSASELFESIYQLSELRIRCMRELAKCDALLTPTAKQHFLVTDLESDPFGPNTELGYYTNYMNLLDFCGVALPGLPTKEGLPYGITLVADRFRDTQLLSIGSFLDAIIRGQTAAFEIPSYSDPLTVDIAVCGAHMEGLPLNWQLTERGGLLQTRTRTAPCYKFYALAGGPPFRPGLMRDDSQGQEIDVEVWRIPADTLASFMGGVPWPLAIGKVALQNGEEVSGFVCEPGGVVGATDITHYGGWRNYLQSLQSL